MISMLRKRLQNDEDGFTLIELMVVVLIIAILLAIAIPTFLNAQKSAKDKSAMSEIRNGITAVRTIATDAGGSFGTSQPDLVEALNDAEPNITFAEAVADGTITVVLNAATVTLYTEAETGNFFGATTNEAGEVVQCESKGEAADVADVSTHAQCVLNEVGGTASPT